MAQYKMICPNCGLQYDQDSKAGRMCTRCGRRMEYSGYTSEEYSRLTVEEQTELIASKREKTVTRDTAASSGGLFWAGFADLFASISLVLGIIASLAGGIIIGRTAGGFVGILIVVIGVLVTMGSVAGIKMLVHITYDINRIKNAGASRSEKV